ncbi:MAG: ABC transporter permease [Gammaproteobacteria bacterium]
MTFYALRRVGLAVLIVCLAMLFLLSAIHLVPGDPAGVALGPRATPEMREAFRVRMGLDQPFIIQYVRFLGNVATGDLGVDVWSQRPVASIIGEQLPHTLALTFLGLGWAIAVGIPLGCFSAAQPNSLLDKVVGVVSVSAIAVPSFIIAIYSLLIFAVALKWLPAIGVGAPASPLDQLRHLILPSFAIGLGWVGYLARLVRASMLEVMGENHIRMARAYGLPRRRITYVYALKLAILPTVALLGVGVGGLLSGAVFAEIVFARPGIGKLVYDAVATRNYPIVMGGVLVSTVLYAASTLVSDLIAATLDPRIRQSL